MNHPNVDPRLLDAIQQVEGNNGFKIEDLEQGTMLEFRTHSGSLYTIVVIDPTKYEVALSCESHQETREFDLYVLHGSTFGGSVTKVGWIVIGMHPKFNRLRDGALMITTALENFVFVNNPERVKEITAEVEAKRPKPATEEDMLAWRERIDGIINGFGDHAAPVRALLAHFCPAGIGRLLDVFVKAAEGEKLEEALKVVRRHLDEHWGYKPPSVRGMLMTPSDVDYLHRAYRELELPLPEGMQS